jgi:hypothetical protein
MTTASALTKPAQIRVSRRSPAYWCVTIGNPPVNVMGPEMVKEFQEVINALEADEQIRVVVFDSAVVILPGNTPHFHWAKSGEYITQVTAMGRLDWSISAQKMIREIAVTKKTARRDEL